MAMRDFIMTDAQANCHAWDPTTAGRLECSRCRTLATERDGAYYRLYPATRGDDCEIRCSQLAHLGDVRQGSIEQLPVIQAEIGEVRLTFPNGCAPAYLAAIVEALIKRAS